MNPNTLIKEIDETLLALDKLITPIGEDETGEYAKRRANEKFMEKKLKAVIAIEKKKYEGSEAARTTEAEASKEYSDALWELAKAQGLSYQVQATKDLLELRAEILRSKLSFTKFMQEKTV